MSGYNFDFSYLPIYPTVTSIIAQLKPKRWSGNSSPAFVVSLLSQTEIIFVLNIYDNMFIISFFKPESLLFNIFQFDFFFNNDISVDLHWILWLIEYNFLEYSSSINLFKTCLSSGFTDKYWKLLTQIEFPGPLRSRTYILLDWGYVLNWSLYIHYVQTW